MLAEELPNKNSTSTHMINNLRKINTDRNHLSMWYSLFSVTKTANCFTLIIIFFTLTTSFKPSMICHKRLVNLSYLFSHLPHYEQK